TGNIAKNITKEYNLDPRKSASLLDTFSCIVQGMLPYGAQLLMASSFAGISATSIISHLYYPFTLFFFAILSIIIRFPRKYS
ncbi:MAG: Na+/H+ antiporter NhaC family protein, partial [Bacteroidales bacterium]|nr:Na+/H+ antiporter NhaC family protein [Bacteroidales bacterium]